LGYPEVAHFFLLMYSKSRHHPALHKMHQMTLEIGEKRILSTLLQNGKFKKSVKTKQLASGLHSILIGEIVKMVSLNDFSNHKIYLVNIRVTMETLIGQKLGSIQVQK